MIYENTKEALLKESEDKKTNDILLSLASIESCATLQKQNINDFIDS